MWGLGYIMQLGIRLCVRLSYIHYAAGYDVKSGVGCEVRLHTLCSWV